MPSILRGRPVLGPGCTPEQIVRGKTNVGISGLDVLWHMLKDRAMGSAVGWLLYHLLVCGIVFLAYRCCALPDAIRSCIGSRAVVAATLTRGVAISAWLSIGLIPVVLILHRVLWGSYMARKWVDPSAVTLSVGPVGVGLMYSGAAFGHLVVVGWAVRRQIRRAVLRLPGVYCTKCGYELAGAAGPTCPECGSPDARRRTLSTFGLTRLSFRFQGTRWGIAFVPLIGVAIASLYMGPVLLPLIGRILPMPVLEFIGKVYDALF